MSTAVSLYKYRMFTCANTCSQFPGSKSVCLHGAFIARELATFHRLIKQCNLSKPRKVIDTKEKSPCVGLGWGVISATDLLKE